MWTDPAVELTVIDAADLLAHFRKLGAACAIAKAWRKVESAHRVTLALAGALLGSGWAEDDAERFITAVRDASGHPPDASDIAGAISSTAGKVKAGLPVTGWRRVGVVLAGRHAQGARLARCGGRLDPTWRRPLSERRRFD